MDSIEEVSETGPEAALSRPGAALWQTLVSPRFTLLLFLALIFLALLGTLFAQSGIGWAPLEKVDSPELSLHSCYQIISS